MKLTLLTFVTALIEASLSDELATTSDDSHIKSEAAELRADVYDLLNDDTSAEYEYMAASLLARDEDVKENLKSKSLACKERKRKLASVAGRAMHDAERSIVPLNLEKLRDENGKLSFSEDREVDRVYTREVLATSSDKLQAVLLELDNGMSVVGSQVQYKGAGAQALAEAILTDHNAFAIPPGKDSNFRLYDKMLLLCDMEQTSLNLPDTLKPVVDMPRQILAHLDTLPDAAETAEKLATLAATTIVQGMCELNTGSAVKAELHFLWTIMLIELVQEQKLDEIRADSRAWRFFSTALWRATRLLHLLSTYRIKHAESDVADPAEHFQPVVDLAAFIIESAAEDTTPYSTAEHVAFKLLHMAQASEIIASCLEARLYTFSPLVHLCNDDGTWSYNPRLVQSIAKLYASAQEHAPIDSNVKNSAAYATTVMSMYHEGITIRDLFTRLQQAETYNKIVKPVFGPVIASDPHRLELLSIAHYLRTWVVDQVVASADPSQDELERLLEYKVERLPILDGYYRVNVVEGQEQTIRFVQVKELDPKKRGVKPVKFVSKVKLPKQ
ncbi:hypothetical protein ACM66B_002434 [Microbotryomycetes sp. NB124-2]